MSDGFKQTVMSIYRLIAFSLFYLLTASSRASAESEIMLNQTGFYPYAPKFAVVAGPVTAASFYLLNEAKDTVFTGKLGAEQHSSNSNLVTRLIDFSAFSDTGTYRLAVPGAVTSYPFYIRPAVMNAVAIAVLKGYYYQRASMPLLPAYAGKWARAAGHPDADVTIHPNAADQFRPAGTKIPTPLGWYDAGDYNKYIVNSGITMGTLLGAYEDFPEYFNHLSTNIPESGNQVPDLLNEAIYNLRWMLTMQDANDGGVYHKCTNAGFDNMVMPDKARATRYVVQKSTAAALDFAAVTAQASRVLKPFLPALADSCLKASRKAWKWAEGHPGVPYNQDSINKLYSPAISTGTYGDNRFHDEWVWAAAELYSTTGDAAFLRAFEAYLPNTVQLPNWGNVAMLGYYTMLRKDRSSSLSTRLQEDVLKLATHYLDFYSAFHTVMGQSVRDFTWGSNDVAAHQGMLLLFAYRLTRDKRYVNRALENLDYILGRNATGYSFVTGYGSKTPMFPHHRPSAADGIAEPVPGLVAGGPNPGMQDKCKYEFTDPERAYTDQTASYASNEIAINWNAPLVYLANGIEALQQEAGYVKTPVK
ncbi:endoglucanase [Chitinophaga terrae (ex Kim and Jung 2007)]|uniref:Endoglucanase n=2 Tax=Chitinophaga terrae (ex Kim and Jung 2007) TaxID=408074 RepID=A0A1H4G0L7_9BACT|nr:endoglucanase [Chitinophaga terrae (ex Kim and Jung 2007)]